MPILSAVKRVLVGKPIATKHAHHERLPKRFALPVFASDALSSVAYATEEIMRVFAFSAVGVGLIAYTINVSVAICLLIGLVALSYYQTIHAYPSGGGSYIVASRNLGKFAGEVAGASLLIDYVLTVSVSISSGVAAVVSLYPHTKPFVMEMCIGSILIVTIANLRGTKESGALFALPTYGFITLVLGLIVKGLFFTAAPIAQQIADPATKQAMTQVGWGMTFLLLHAFASGCTALTGIEAISNGVQAFKEPVAQNASRTLAAMAIILAVMFIGISILAQRFHTVPLQYEDPAYQTIPAQICAQVFGKGTYFWLLQVFTALILILAANTAYADFPRLASLVAKDGYLPRQLSILGDKLVFQNGIVVLAAFATLLIVAFGGDTSRLVPLYAVGVFVGFTLSQYGMVVHERREKKPFINIALSAFGGTVTLVVTGVLLYTKFSEGAYIVPFAMAAMIVMFSLIKRHYLYLAGELNLAEDDAVPVVHSTALLLVPRVHKGILQAIAYAQSMAQDCRALHVTIDKVSAEQVKTDWVRFGSDIPLVILESPYRSLVEPIEDYIDQTRAEDPNTMITVIVPQAVPKHWWQAILHNNIAVSLKYRLRNKKNVVVTNVRYFLK